MDHVNLSNIQLDALKEVTNIGAGNAATALSMMLGKKIEMTVPSVNMIKLSEMYNDEAESLVCGIVVRVLGDIQGNILIIFKESVAHDIVEMLTGVKENEISELGDSALCEIGNILSGSYMNAITQFTGLCVIPSVPAVAHDMLGAILATTFVESGQYDENILDIETVFSDELNSNIGAHFYYIPVPGSFEKILKSIGVY